jgi:hypothetical protein
MEKSSNLLHKLSRSLFADTAEQEKFIQAVINPQAFNPAILWLQPKPQKTHLLSKFPSLGNRNL